MVLERPDCSLDARLVTDAGVMLIDFQDQVGLPVTVHDPPEIFQGAGIGTAFERGDVNGIQSFHPGRVQGPFQDPCRVVPVQAVEERVDFGKILPILREHVLEGFDPVVAESIQIPCSSPVPDR